MGCVGIRVESPEEVQPAIDKANEIDDRPVVVEFRTDSREKVFPMVPAGPVERRHRARRRARTRGRAAMNGDAAPPHPVGARREQGRACSPASPACSPGAGYNIFSLAVAPTEDERFSRITIVVDVESAPLEQIVKQLFKLINVVQDHRARPAATSVERELLLATVARRGRAAQPGRRARAASSRARSSPSATEALTVSLEGHPDKLDDFEELLRAVRHRRAPAHRPGRAAQARTARLHASARRRRERQADGRQRVLRDGRRSVAHPGRKVAIIGYGSQGHAPRAEPEGLGRRRACRSARGLVVERQGRGGRAAGAADRPRPRPRPT